MTAKFDYRQVWTPSLLTAKPIVHDLPNGFLLVTGRRPGTKSLRSKCFHAERMIQLLDDEGRVRDSYYRGVDLYMGHAKAIGARFCKVCWPNGPGT